MSNTETKKYLGNSYVCEYYDYGDCEYITYVHLLTEPFYSNNETVSNIMQEIERIYGPVELSKDKQLNNKNAIVAILIHTHIVEECFPTYYEFLFDYEEKALNEKYNFGI